MALNKIEKIINNAMEVNTSPTDMTHNTSPKTLEHKQNVVEYVYFDSPIRIGTDLYNVELATERMKGQDPDVLDLYNVHVKKTPAAAHLSTLQTEGFNYNNTTSDENVNPHTNLLFQSAYHGSGASFDKFDTL